VVRGHVVDAPSPAQSTGAASVTGGSLQVPAALSSPEEAGPSEFLRAAGDTSPSYDAVELVAGISLVDGVNAVTGAQATCPGVPPLPVVVGPQVIGAAGPGDVSLPISSSAQGELESQPVSGPSAFPSSVTAPAAAPAVLIPPPMANGDSEEVAQICHPTTTSATLSSSAGCTPCLLLC